VRILCLAPLHYSGKGSAEHHRVALHCRDGILKIAIVISIGGVEMFAESRLHQLTQTSLPSFGYEDLPNPIGLCLITDMIIL
jgi:hypothetical protein